MVHYIMKIYAPVWSDIKRYSSVKYGLKQLLKVVECTRQFPENVNANINAAIARNTFFCHPENILLVMVGDETKDNRKLS